MNAHKLSSVLTSTKVYDRSYSDVITMNTAVSIVLVRHFAV